METQFPGATERERFHEALRQLIDLLVSGLIEGTVAAAAASGVADFEEVRRIPGAAGPIQRRDGRNQPRAQALPVHTEFTLPML